MYPADDRPERLACLFVRMDGLDSSAAVAAKNDAARLLTAAQLSFTAIAEQLEQRRLLMPPDIIAAIKRIDLPGEGDAAFVGTRKLLARAKLSFQDIAQALEHASVSPAEHAALARELAALRNVYVRQQVTIARLKLMLGFTWFSGFLQRSFGRTGLLCGALIVAVLLFTTERGLLDFGSGLAQAGGARSAQATLVQQPSILAAAQPDKRQAAAATLPPIVNVRAEPTVSPRMRSMSQPAPRRRVERNTDEYSERPRYRAQPNCWGGVGGCGWGGFRS
ncbi:MAG TPA: hypothetical protein VK281_00260 [Xanthobacteraceae bacterium]|nr:hypothetical protein [Xanthobacteraceae bacterium]